MIDQAMANEQQEPYSGLNTGKPKFELRINLSAGLQSLLKGNTI